MKMFQAFRGNQRGISVLAIVFVILVLTAIGYAFSNMMAAKQKSIPLTLDAARAFYIAEGGLQFAGRFLDSRSWNPPPAPETRNLGDGSFTVQFGSYSSAGGRESITATATGSCGLAQRVLVATFNRWL